MREDLTKKYSRYGVGRVAKALFQQHSFDPDIAWLAAWYVLKFDGKNPKFKQGYGKFTKSYVRIDDVPKVSEEDAKGFLYVYTQIHGGEKE